MKFEQMLAFWKMKGMVHQNSCHTRTKIYETKNEHVVYSAEIRDFERGGSVHAKIIYRYTELGGVGFKTGMALVYADIVFTGFPDDSTNQVFIKNAKVSDLGHHLIDRL